MLKIPCLKLHQNLLFTGAILQDSQIRGVLPPEEAPGEAHLPHRQVMLAGDKEVGNP